MRLLSSKHKFLQKENMMDTSCRKSSCLDALLGGAALAGVVLAGTAALLTIVENVIKNLDNDVCKGEPSEATADKQTRLHELLEIVPNLTNWTDLDMKAAEIVADMVFMVSEENLKGILKEVPLFSESGRKYVMAEITLIPQEVKGLLTRDEKSVADIYAFRDILSDSQDYYVMVRPEIASVIVVKKKA
jgi:hypothetical protein